MTNSEAVGGAGREELVQRIELMEAMIGEGRRLTARYGWAFLSWGVIDLAVMIWKWLMPHSNWVGLWAWPIGLITATMLTIAGVMAKKRAWGVATNQQVRMIVAVWSVLGIAMLLFVGGGMLSGFTWQVSYMAGLLIMVGMAHAVSAIVLRWVGQGVFAALWGIGGAAMFLDPTHRQGDLIMLVELCVGMIVFGIYTMVLERRYRG
jgi:hypothetical protein